MAIALGGSIGDLVLLRPDGTLFDLGDQRGKAILLVFVRHLA